MRSPQPENRLDLLKHETMDTIQLVLDRIARIDQTLKMCGDILFIAQPRQSGNLGLKWDNRDIYPLPFPYIVEYNKGKKNYWVENTVRNSYLTLKMKTRGDFAEHAETVRTTLEQMQYLMAERTNLIAMLGNLRMTIKKKMRCTDVKMDAIMSRTMLVRAKLDPLKRQRVEEERVRKAGGQEKADLAAMMEPVWEDVAN